jgi:hypothetical protein
MQQFSDELDDLQVPTLPQQVPSKANGKATAVAPAKSAPATVPDADDVDFDDAEYLKDTDFIGVIKIVRGEFARFAWAPGFKLKHGKVHYFTGVGSVRCASTEEKKAPCCAKGAPKDKFIGLAFSYSNIDKKSGKFASPETKPEIEVKAVRLSRANYKDIVSGLEEDQKPVDVDFKFFHDPSRSFGYRFAKIANTPRWHMVREQALALLEPYKTPEGQAKLASRLGKTLTAAELAGLAAGGDIDEDPSLEDVESM